MVEEAQNSQAMTGRMLPKARAVDPALDKAVALPGLLGSGAIAW